MQIETTKNWFNIASQYKLCK